MPDAAFPKSVTPTHTPRLQDPERLASLHRSEMMDTLPEAAFDRAVRLATDLLGVPVGLLSMVDGERQFFKARQGLGDTPEGPRTQTPLSHSFCQYVVTEDRPLAVSDARTHPLLHDNGAVRDLNVVAYLGVPVHAPDGQVLGSFCAIDAHPRAWSDRDKRAIADLVAMVENELALREENRQRQLLLSEMNHRIKNMFAIVSGMVGMTARTAESAQTMAADLRGRINALARAHDMVRPEAAVDGATSDAGSLQALVLTLLAPHRHHSPDRVTVAGPDLTTGLSGATNLALVLHEFATNAAKYGALSVSEGELSVTWSLRDDQVHLTWAETGAPAMPAPPSAKGFGSQLVDMTIRGQFRGTIVTDWRLDGVTHHLTLCHHRVAA